MFKSEQSGLNVRDRQIQNFKRVAVYNVNNYQDVLQLQLNTDTRKNKLKKNTPPSFIIITIWLEIRILRTADLNIK